MDQPDGEQYTDEPGDEQERLTGPDDALSSHYPDHDQQDSDDDGRGESYDGRGSRVLGDQVRDTTEAASFSAGAATGAKILVAAVLDTQVQHSASVGKWARTTTRSSRNVSTVTTFREEGLFRRA